MQVVSLLAQQQLEVARDVTPGDVRPHDAVWHGEPLVDGHRVSHAVTRVQHHARRATRRVSTPRGNDLTTRSVVAPCGNDLTTSSVVTPRGNDLTTRRVATPHGNVIV